MNLNPFVYSYKIYPNSKLATYVSNVCGAMQRIFLLFGVGIALVVACDEVSNSGEALIGSAVMLLLWLLIKLNKDKWSDKIAAKQDSVDNNKNCK